ncbi:methyltransferase domain-containing protein [Sediminibacterium ginsengisoli]|uniref:2-polyprenyl-3-methyl-5-hydroxy-6-metoxy-1,4-benzoquinol methylase n=1 Tax=Sediminibacterium ginsengisoli TaxID=413434 RepID=A0A1T4PM49_9BACT|nr:methyltransferase domain-containing protein [Sediminibacterium ginsengisoli]SJZ92431.1 2-polyprenyl-3-methyl-5-hydroxy-6-metoxy-1,4-benzoquinol methylase [Sediminibacterium ginsengisoli]
MSKNINYSHCPCCNSADINPVLSAEDYTVSHELFEIWHCNHCSNRFTQDVPDAANIGPYYQSDAYVSHSDTKQGLINKLYHAVRNYTLQKKRSLVQQVTDRKQGSLLDVGAGTGAFAGIMKQAGWQVTGLEPDDTARNVAAEKNGIQLLAPGELYQLAPDQFDAISLWHVMEHVHDLHGYIRRFSAVLRQNGRLLIAVPNYTSQDAEVYGKYWAAYDVPRHLYHFSPAGMEQMMLAEGFVLTGVKPMWFDSFYVAMLSEQYRKGKSNLFRAAWVGLMSNLKAVGNKKRCSSVIYIFSKK